MEKVMNKLVRDKIPDIISANGEVAVTRVLSDSEYKVELYKKLIEEANEVVSSNNKEELTEELADLSEVVRSILLLNNITSDEVETTRSKKYDKRGGFEKRIFLEKTISKD